MANDQFKPIQTQTKLFIPKRTEAEEERRRKIKERVEQYEKLAKAVEEKSKPLWTRFNSEDLVQSQVGYHCPFDRCTHTNNRKDNMKTHMEKKHKWMLVSPRGRRSMGGKEGLTRRREKARREARLEKMSDETLTPYQVSCRKYNKKKKLLAEQDLFLDSSNNMLVLVKKEVDEKTGRKFHEPFERNINTTNFFQKMDENFESFFEAMAEKDDLSKRKCIYKCFLDYIHVSYPRFIRGDYNENEVLSMFLNVDRALEDCDKNFQKSLDLFLSKKKKTMV